MSIFERIQRIAKANINLWLNRIEPPEQELEAKIRELEEAIADGRGCAASYGATFRRLERQADELRQQRGQWQARAEDAILAADDATAHRALTERVRVSERLAGLEPGIEQGRRTYEQLRDNLVKLQDQLRNAKVKLAELRSRKQAAAAHRAFHEQLDRTSARGGEPAAFERLEDEVVQAEAHVEVQDEMCAGSLADADLEHRARELQVEAEMRALKKRLTQG